jgi:hypothetical protein
MKPSIKTLGEILYSPSQYVIPVFQRNYRWERPNWEQFWESIIEIQRPDKRGNHFMGFLVFFPELAQPGQNTSFHLIDGQQRLATSSILLAAIRNVARQTDQNELADEIHQDYLVHHRKKGDQYYRLFPKERDHDSYLAIISGQGEPTGRMGDALAYFDEQLVSYAAEQADQSVDGLRRAFDTVRQRFEFMCAHTRKGRKRLQHIQEPEFDRRAAGIVRLNSQFCVHARDPGRSGRIRPRALETSRGRVCTARWHARRGTVL